MSLTVQFYEKTGNYHLFGYVEGKAEAELVASLIAPENAPQHFAAEYFELTSPDVNFCHVATLAHKPEPQEKPLPFEAFNNRFVNMTVKGPEQNASAA